MAPINVTTSKQQITASVAEDKVTATVTGGFGATGPSGVINVTAPITNAGTTTAANVGLSIGSGLSVSGGSLVVTPDTYATLVGGKVPAEQLPSYVDDVLEYANLASLPVAGESGKIYIALNTGKIYRWSGSAYFEISTQPGNTDAVPEGSTNLYFTNARARNAFGTGTTGQVITWSGGQWTAATPITYTLPTATASVLGGVKIGSGISIDGNGVISASSAYTLPTATNSVLGGVKIGTGVTITDGVISVSTNYAAANHTHAWNGITDKPSTFAPSAHKTSHSTGGSDALTPSDIGAAAASDFNQGVTTTADVTFNSLTLNTVGKIEATDGVVGKYTRVGAKTPDGTAYGYPLWVRHDTVELRGAFFREPTTQQIAFISPASLTDTRTLTLPDASGTIALTSQLFSGAYADLTGKPTLATVATSGSAADLSGTLNAARLPSTTVTAASYGSASSVATFTVDATGRLTAAGSTSIAIAAGAVSGLAAVATSGSASDLSAGTVPIARIPTGSTSSTVCIGNDARLVSDGNKGDITVGSNNTSWTINAGAVVTADIADGAVTTAKIANSAVTLAKTTGIQKSITSGTAAPTGGSDGDIYLQYT